jgi:GDPmannose 4,6-dehydratase
VKKALVVGCSGQDGTLLTAHLGRLGYDVIGISRSSLSIEDAGEVERLIAEQEPAEVYFLAAYHHSSEDPPIAPRELFERSNAVHVLALLNFLEAIRARSPRTRLFYAASSLIFGDVTESPQTETTPIAPTCAYGITKSAGLQICRFYRRNHGIHASVGILYNHESPLRAEKFVTRKIVKAAWAIKRGTRDKLTLGNLAAEMDAGYAPEYVDAMHRIVGLDGPDDFIIATGELHSIRELVELAFARVGLDWRTHVEENPALITRPPLRRVGNAGKLAGATGWRPATTFSKLVATLMDAEEALSRESA